MASDSGEVMGEKTSGSCNINGCSSPFCIEITLSITYNLIISKPHFGH